MNGGAIKTAVVTGAHGFSVVDFHHLFRGLEGVDCYIQHLDDFACATEAERDSYDAVVLYFFVHPYSVGDAGRGEPQDAEEPWFFARKPRAAIEHLGDTQQGIVVLHHALLTYPDWSLLSQLVGIEDRSFAAHFDQHLRIDVADTRHPITEGIASWEMGDETYTMADAQEGSEILLTTAHAKSMRTIGWTREHKQARVFCFQSGHDNQTWQEPGFRQVLQRGIHWVSRRI
ncbi:MAG: ThuA domain-containing protein [Spirochaetaceae bacterium]|nr:ThuA domain-containing protein [Spirochaetaceae bacterium]